jgi:dTDP-4-dehydrorhamnose reductase
MSGVWHVASEPINKFELLTLIKRALKLEIEIEPNESFICDRSLDGERFRQTTGVISPSWPEMIDRMAQDKTPYEEIRRTNAG